MIEAERSNRLAAMQGIAHGFYGRQGGLSQGLYASLNCGLGSMDDRAHVLENRRRVVADLLADELSPAKSRSDRAQPVLLTPYQVHSAEACIVTEPWLPDQQPRLDGLVTRTPGIVLGALAADCTPVLLADSSSGVVAALHAGWKGALSGIVSATISMMLEAGARRANIVAAIGPTIHQPNYEVGPEFEARFTAVDPAFQRFFARFPGSPKPHFDLPGFVELQLQRGDISAIDRVGTCTYGSEHRYFSFRRTTHKNQPDYGRQVSAITLV